MVVIAIIGTAGRDKSALYTKELFDKMVTASKHMLTNITDITLVSGGAAWADHIAVRLYLEGYVNKLILYLPCQWNGAQYLDTGEYDWRVNPGRTSNYYHKKFSTIIGVDSLNEIAEAIAKGAEIHVQNGFHARNNEVANCDNMIAFTWSKTNVPADGGTLNTWKLCLGTKYHISLGIL